MAPPYECEAEKAQLSAIVTSNDEATAGNPQRIDLTQFDNITSYPDGGWEVPKEDNLSKTLVADLDGSLVCSTSAMAQIEGYSLEEAQRFARIIAQLPNIVAELKRTYDKIDVLEERLEFSEHIMETMHDEHYADLVMDFIEEVHPSKWCDWGHCRKCQRLKNE